MHARLLPFLSLVCLVLSGCSAYSAHPLYTTQDAVVEPALEGTWVSTPPDKDEISIQKSGEHEYSLTVPTSSEESVQTYKLNLVRLGNQLFADMFFDSETVQGKKIDTPIGSVSMHVIIRIEVTGDQLSYAILDQDALQKQNALEAAPLKLLSIGDALVITDETDSLRHYISIHAADVFAKTDQLKRKAGAQQQPQSQ
jgi:hypothetical protein